MIVLKVSKGIYLFFTVFFNIIKYQGFGNQYKNDSKEKQFYSLNFNNLSEKLFINTCNKRRNLVSLKKTV